MTVLDMGNIDLTALEIFKTVAEQGGIAKAAGRLHRVPSVGHDRAESSDLYADTYSCVPCPFDRESE